MLLHDAIRLFLQGYFSTCDRSPKTVAAYTCDLRQFREFAGSRVALEEISAGVVESWAYEMKQDGLAPASIRRKLAALRVLMNYWVRVGRLDRSPVSGLRLDLGKRRTLTATLTLDEVQRLLVQARKVLEENSARPRGTVNLRFLACRNLAILELMFATGMRVGEVAGLNLFHVSLDERTVLVNGKGGRERLAVLTDEASFRAIRRYTEERRRVQVDSAALFINVFRRPLSTQGIASMLAKLARAAGIEKHVTPHMLRHTVATLLLRNGADIRVVQEFLGHASITTTQRYTHVTKEHLASTLQRHHPRLQILAS